MQQALPYRKVREPRRFPTPSIPYASRRRSSSATTRSSSTTATAAAPRSIDFFSGTAPTTVAPCKPNEVDVPHLGGELLADAEARLHRAAAAVSRRLRDGHARGASRRRGARRSRAAGRSPPTTRSTSGSRAQRTGSSRGSSGWTVPRARAKLARLSCTCVFQAGPPAEWSRRAPARALRRRPGCSVVLHGQAVLNGRLTNRRAGGAVAPGAVDGLRQADPGAGHDLGLTGPPPKLERRPVERRARRGPRSRRAPGRAARGPSRGAASFSTPAACRASSSSPWSGSSARTSRALADALRPADEIQAPVDAIGAVHVGVPGRAEHRAVPRGAAAKA